MFLTKKHLSRRTVLQAAGISLSLPLLDAMIPAHTALAQTAAKPRLRAGFFYLPHGAIMWNTPYGKDADRWSPSGAGANFKLSPILAPLESYKSYVASFANLENKAPRWIAAGPNLAWSHGRSWVSAAMGIGLYQIKTAPALQWGIMF